MISNVLLLGGGTNTKIGTNPVSSSSDGPSVSTVVQNTAGATAQTGGILEKVIVLTVLTSHFYILENHRLDRSGNKTKSIFL